MLFLNYLNNGFTNPPLPNNLIKNINPRIIIAYNPIKINCILPNIKPNIKPTIPSGAPPKNWRAKKEGLKSFVSLNLHVLTIWKVIAGNTKQLTANVTISLILKYLNFLNALYYCDC